MTQSTITPATHKPTDKPLLPPRKQEYSYNWSLIFLVIVGVLALGGISAYGYYAWFSPVPQQEMELAATQPEPQVLTESQPTNLDDQGIQPSIEEGFADAEEQQPLPEQVAEDAVSMPGAEDAVKPLLEEAIIDDDILSPEFVADQPLESLSSTAEPAQPPMDEPAVLEATEELSAKPVYFVDPEITVDAETTEELPVEPAEAELVQPQADSSEQIPMEREAENREVEITPVSGTASGLFQLVELKILEPRVKRFLLAGTVSNKEPLGELHDIRFNEDGIAVVWAYSEVVEMRGSRLNYVWLHEGSQVARVPVGVRGSRWRSYSSKNINQAMIGGWRLELQDDAGRLLASADFLL